MRSCSEKHVKLCVCVSASVAFMIWSIKQHKLTQCLTVSSYNIIYVIICFCCVFIVWKLEVLSRSQVLIYVSVTSTPLSLCSHKMYEIRNMEFLVHQKHFPKSGPNQNIAKRTVVLMSNSTDDLLLFNVFSSGRP